MARRHEFETGDQHLGLPASGETLVDSPKMDAGGLVASLGNVTLTI